MMTFYLATAVFMVITWFTFLIGLITNRIKRSTMYGLLAVSYVSHSLACNMMGLPWFFYLGFSLFFLGMHWLTKKVENNLTENDIKKKENE
jgi:hypothetical protein